ncbi:hypothetical protein [Streptococcus pseudopneumoniae]|uniref:hypothetical protein n=1 Tax=Streptococcus pseudopneumoniae TaxID=257758 RepID=UPI00066A9B62|nr:hypothetical protein [Streptococcus pseudopneumoniae]
MTFEINGLDDFSNRLDQLSENAQSVAGTHEYSFTEVFSDEFMIEHTNFSTIDEFLLSSPEKISNAEEFEKADESILDVFVSEQTKFNTWKEMMSAAAQILIMKKLGF